MVTDARATFLAKCATDAHPLPGSAHVVEAATFRLVRARHGASDDPWFDPDSYTVWSALARDLGMGDVR